MAIADSNAKAPVVELYFVCDTTGSMGETVNSLSSTLKQVFCLVKVLCPGRMNIHVVSYKDYDVSQKQVVQICPHSGFSSRTLKFISSLSPGGGRDFPEAVKTALNQVLNMIHQQTNKTHKSIVILYTDAPPHHPQVPSVHINTERKELSNKQKYPHAGFDWISICNEFHNLNTPVFTFFTGVDDEDCVFYALLGTLIKLHHRKDNNAVQITKATVGLLLQLMGEAFDFCHEFHTNIYEMPHDGAIQNENGFRFPEIKTVELTERPFTFEPMSSMVQDLSKLPEMFKKYEKYQQVVFDVLLDLFTPKHIVAITYNPVIGKLYRLCCQQRLNPRLQPLVTNLSKCVPALPPKHKKQVQSWIDDSYDYTDKIQEIIESEPNATSFLVLDAVQGIDKDDLRSLARAPTAAALKSAQSILTHLIVIEDIEDRDNFKFENGSPSYLPLSIPSDKLFSILPHLMFPGTMFSRFGSCIVAILSYMSGNIHLKDKAKVHLESQRGKWIRLDQPEDYPEIFTLPFIKLLSFVPELLTETELAAYQMLYKISRLRSAAPLEFDVRIGFVPKIAQVRPDIKYRCKRCGLLRSFTLMATSDICGLCISDPNNSKSCHDSQDCAFDQSHMVRCHTCCGIYAVVCVRNLNVRPKCHYCRSTHSATKTPLIECSKCLNIFVDPENRESTKASGNNWVCPVCSIDCEKGVETVKATLFELMSDNKALIDIFGFGGDKEQSRTLIFSTDKYFKLYVKHRDVLLLQPAEIQMNTKSFVCQRSKVLFVPDLLETIKEQVLVGKLAEYCNLCFDIIPLVGLESSCGRCHNKVCSDCLDHWYGEVKPGKLVLPSHLVCAFCKQHPTAKALKKHNKQICTLLRSEKKVEWLPRMYYGWCTGCYKVKEMVAMDCARDPPLDVENFVCADCHEQNELNIQYQAQFFGQAGEFAHLDLNGQAPESKEFLGTLIKCPKCSIQTSKAGGCSHITCHCGAHWCFECGKSFDADVIYDHMYGVHGGLGF